MGAPQRRLTPSPRAAQPDRKGIAMSALRILTVLLTGVLVVAAGAAAAGDGPHGNLPDLFALEADCRIGNLNPPVGPSYPGVFNGNEAYAYFVQPNSQCSDGEEAFQLETVSMLVDFGPDQVPQTLVVRSLLLNADFDTGSDCFVPGRTICEGPELVFTFDTPGIKTITAPLDACYPLPLDSQYFLSLSFEGGGPASLPVDDEPQECIEYINTGNGWTDLYDQKTGDDKSGGGKVIVFGDVVFVIAGVPVENTSWGAIKTLYR